MIENYAACVLQAETPELTGWKKSSSGSEVDFVARHGDKIVPVECKAAVQIKNTHLGGLRDGMRHLGAAHGILLSLAPFEIRRLGPREAILILPLYLAERWHRFYAEALTSSSNRFASA